MTKTEKIFLVIVAAAFAIGVALGSPYKLKSGDPKQNTITAILKINADESRQTSDRKSGILARNPNATTQAQAEASF